MFRKLTMLVACLALAWSGVARAQSGQRFLDGTKITGPIHGSLGGVINPSDSVARVGRSDASGNAMVNDADRDRDANLTFQDAINNFGASALAIGAGDSSIVLNTHDMRLGMLVIKAVLAGTGTVDTTCIARLAVQIRTHINGVSDSMSTAGIYSYGSAPLMATTAAGAVADTSKQGHLYAGVPITGIAATPGANTAWSGEFDLWVMAKRNAHGSSISVNGHTWYYPSMIAIPLSSLFGREPYSPFTSIRIRLMSFQKGAASLTTGTVFVAAHLIGTPL